MNLFSKLKSMLVNFESQSNLEDDEKYYKKGVAQNNKFKKLILNEDVDEKLKTYLLATTNMFNLVTASFLGFKIENSDLSKVVDNNNIKDYGIQISKGLDKHRISFTFDNFENAYYNSLQTKSILISEYDTLLNHKFPLSPEECNEFEILQQTNDSFQQLPYVINFDTTTYNKMLNNSLGKYSELFNEMFSSPTINIPKQYALKLSQVLLSIYGQSLEDIHFNSNATVEKFIDDERKCFPNVLNYTIEKDGVVKKVPIDFVSSTIVTNYNTTNSAQKISDLSQSSYTDSFANYLDIYKIWHEVNSNLDIPNLFRDTHKYTDTLNQNKTNNINNKSADENDNANDLNNKSADKNDKHNTTIDEDDKTL